MADNLLDKASILLTPTAYNDGSMLSIKPNENLYGSELVTNGDFATDSDWNKQSGWSISGGTANTDGTPSSEIRQNNVTIVGKQYKYSFTISNSGSGVFNARLRNKSTGTPILNFSSEGTYSGTFTSNGTFIDFVTLSNNTASFSIGNVSVKEDLSGDFTFSRSSAVTRVNAQGLVENVQILSSELVSNGNFSQIATEEVSNGNFSQEGSELVTNGDFATDSDRSLQLSASISQNKLIVSNVSQNTTIATQSSVAPTQKPCKLQFDIVVNTGSFRILLGSSGTSTTVTESGTYTLYETSGNFGTLTLQARDGGFDGSIDNVSVKEVGQDWNLGSGITISENQANFTGNANSFLTQSGVVTLNKTYKATFTVSNYVSGAIDINLGGSTRQGNISANGTYTFYIPVPSGNILYFQEDFSNGFTGSISNISVKEVGQDWTLGTGWSIGDDKASCDGSQSSQSNLYQAGIVPINNTYKVTFDIVVTSGSVYLSIGGSNAQPTVSSSGTYTFTSKATTGDSNLYFSTNSTFIGSVTNISLKEITDDTDLPRINYEGFSYQDSLGSELVVNGDFATDSNWNKETGWTISGGTANYSGGTNNRNIRQAIGITNGKKYKVQYEVKAITSGEVACRFGGMSGINEITATTKGTYVGYITANSSANGELLIEDNNNNFIGSIDNVSVKEVLGQEVVPDSGCGSWLLEPQSTNIWTNSNLSASISLDGLTRTLNQSISPSGDSDATLFNETATTGTHRFYRLDIPSTSTDFSMSFFAKKNGINIIRIVVQGGTKYADFDLSLGTVGNESGINSSAIEDYGNGWYRCVINVTATGWVGLYALNDSSQNSYLGNVSKGVYLYGAQLEQQSYATSYIPTNGATSTRLQDIATNSGNSTLINSTEGVLYAEISFLENGRIGISNTDNSDQVVIGNAGGLFYRITENNSDPITEFIAGGVDNINKIALKYKSTDTCIFVNGFKLDTSIISYSLSGLDSLQLTSQGSDFYGSIKALAVYKEALTDANLRSLTYPNPVATTFDLDFDTIAEQFTFTRGSEATFVNAQGLIESTASNDAPRIDYSTGAKAFLLENQSTNLIPYSSDFSQSAWTKYRSSILSNNAISPDGTLNADKLVDNSNNATHALEERRYSLSSGSQYTYSFFAKASEVKQVGLLASNPSQGSIFDLENGIVYGDFVSAPNSSKIENFGNGWYRCSIITTLTSTDSKFGIYLAKNGSTNYTGNSTDGLYIFGAMLEQQSYATSYIPTSGASATRNQELCNNATPVINSEEGTLYAEISAFGNGGVDRNISLNDNTPSNYVQLIFHATDNRIVFRVNSGGVAQVNIDDYTFEQTDNLKIACVYKQNNFSLWINGIERATDFSGNIPIGLSKLDFSLFNGTQPFFGNTKGLKYYPKALADVQLEDLTTI